MQMHRNTCITNRGYGSCSRSRCRFLHHHEREEGGLHVKGKMQIAFGTCRHLRRQSRSRFFVFLFFFPSPFIIWKEKKWLSTVKEREGLSARADFSKADAFVCVSWLGGDGSQSRVWKDVGGKRLTARFLRPHSRFGDFRLKGDGFSVFCMQVLHARSRLQTHAEHTPLAPSPTSSSLSRTETHHPAVPLSPTRLMTFALCLHQLYCREG